MNWSAADLIGHQYRTGDKSLAKVRYDANHAEICKYLRDLGVSVFNMAERGGNFPDTVLGYRGLTMLMEIKTPDGKLSKGQEEFIAKWPATVIVARNGEEAFNAILEEVRKHG